MDVLTLIVSIQESWFYIGLLVYFAWYPLSTSVMWIFTSILYFRNRETGETDFYDGFDKAVQEYNEVYFKPAKAKLDELYDKGLLDKTKFFDENLEVEYYELWHHEGRRARMGAMMMAPDYAWWHGFYECKLRFANYMEEANHLIETGQKAYVAKDFPAATGDTTRPPKIFGKSE